MTNVVAQCKFINHYGSNAIYSTDIDNPNPAIINDPMIQIRVLGGELFQVRDNIFKYEAAIPDEEGLQNSESVIGISSTDGDITIGEFGTSSSNSFVNLASAIDVSRLFNTKTTDIVNNYFINNLRGITINNLPMAHIASNEIFVPSGLDENSDIPLDDIERTYGIFADRSIDYDIIDNALHSIGLGDIQTFGVVIDNSNRAGNNLESELNGNRFSGFGIGTQLENDNRGLQLKCNGYYGTIEIDLAVGEDPENVYVLDEQGEEPIPGVSDLDVLFSTYWHTSNNGLHILNETNDELRFIEDVNSAANPDLIDGIGSFLVLFDGEALGIADMENPCYANLIPDSGPLPNLVDPAGPPNEMCKVGYSCPIDINNCSTISELPDRELSPIIKDLVRDKHQLVSEEENPTAMSVEKVLDCHNSVWSQKFQVGNHVSVRDYTSGRATLEELPQDTEENQAFYTLYDAYITIKEVEEGSGKYYGPLQTIKDLASTDNANGPGQSLAQAMLSNLLGYTYIRRPMPLKTDLSKNTDIEQVCFQIVPNPVSGQFSLDFLSQENKEQNWKGWELYDLQGQLVKSDDYNKENRLNVNGVNNGIYFLKLIDTTGVSCSSRLIIQH